MDKDYAWNSDADRLNFRQLISGSPEKKKDGPEYSREQYKGYKESYVKYIKFDPAKPNPSMYFISRNETSIISNSGVLVDQHTPLEEVFIFFDTATYDLIERDVKVNIILGSQPVQYCSFF